MRKTDRIMFFFFFFHLVDTFLAGQKTCWPLWMRTVYLPSPVVCRARYSDGRQPMSFLKQEEKYFGSL